VKSLEESWQEASCSLCGTPPQVRFLERVRDWSESTPVLSTYKVCGGCSLVLLSPRPIAAAIQRFYPADYAQHSPRYQAYSRTQGMRAVLERLVDARFPAPRMSRVPIGRAPRVLDIGCGSGAYLQQRVLEGWEGWGVESDPRAASVAQHRVAGASIFAAPLYDTAPSLPRSYFDLVTLHDVLEHLHEPVTALRLARELATPGGLVEVLTPDVNSLESRAFGSCWFSVEAPRHLQLFSRKTLQITFERAGLRVAATRPSMTPTFALWSLEYLLTTRLRRRVRFSTLGRLGLRALLTPVTLSSALVLGSGSSIWMWGRSVARPQPAG
jgi:SAM-dependent methyltransferase